MASKYYDTSAIAQVIGCMYKNIELFDNENYVITENDFVNSFHKIVFGILYNLSNNGAKEFTPELISDFLENHPQTKGVFNSNKGFEYLIQVKENANLLTFDYYYNRIKKMSLLRAYDDLGISVTDIYDPDNVLDLSLRQKQEEKLDNLSLEEIANHINDKFSEVYQTYVQNDVFGESVQAGDGLEDLIKEFEQRPDIGVPLYGNYINTVLRGARLGKFYLRSAATGVGKTRSMIADACYISCEKIYDENFGWIKTSGKQFPTLFIGTEQEKSEIQSLMLAFVSNVNEDHITTGKYEEGERERVFEAARIIKNAPLYIEELPEFNLQDVENTIKRNIREHDIRYFFHDYIHSSLKILAEITKQAGHITLREDQVLFMLSARLKEICVKNDVFIMSATQLNAAYQDSDTPDQNLLRGAKSIADKIDAGLIMLSVTDKDKESLASIISKNPHWDSPAIKISVYKNRRGKYKGVYLWCKANLGTCRVQPIFVTNYQYELQTIDNIKIEFRDDNVLDFRE